MAYRNSNSMKKKLGDLLVEVGIISRKQLEKAVDVQKKKGGKLGEILQDLNYCSKEVLLTFLGKRSGVSFVSLSEYGNISQQILSLIPESIARNQTLIPLKKEENTLVVAMSDPLNVFATDDLKIMTGCEIKVVIASEEEIMAAIDKFYKARSKNNIEKNNRSSAKTSLPLSEPVGDVLHQGESISKEQVSSMFDSLLENAFRSSATSIHIEPDENTIHIRYRINGVLQQKPDLLLSQYQNILVAHIKAIARMNTQDLWIPQDGHFKRMIDQTDLDIKVSSVPASHGEKIVLRLINSLSVHFSLDEIGMDPELMNSYKKILSEKKGLILVTGLPNSGKSTTLYSSLSYLNEPRRNIMTIEDPVENYIPGIYQVQSKPDRGLSPSSGIYTLLRQDPDVIFIGEIRDKKMLESALHAAQSGCLVLASFTSTGSVSAVVKLLEMGIDSSLLSQNLLGILSQHLLRRVCGGCRESYAMTLNQLRAAGIHLKALKEKKKDRVFTLYRGKGCGQCLGASYKGRTPVFHLFKLNETVRRFIQDNQSITQIRKVISDTVTLKEVSVQRMLEGYTTLDEVLNL